MTASKVAEMLDDHRRKLEGWLAQIKRQSQDLTGTPFKQWLLRELRPEMDRCCQELQAQADELWGYTAQSNRPSDEESEISTSEGDQGESEHRQ